MSLKYFQVSALALGLVLLSGCTPGERQRTEERATEATGKAEKKIDDATLTASVKSKLAADVRLGTLTSINVDSSGAIVTLSGTVKTPAEKELAETVAKSVDGVASVVNRLEVRRQP